MLVPKPKKAFQSPGTQKRSIPRPVVVVMVDIALLLLLLRLASRRQRFDHGIRFRDPAEDAALGLDHLQAHGLELREIGPHAILEHEAVVAPVVGFAYG